MTGVSSVTIRQTKWIKNSYQLNDLNLIYYSIFVIADIWAKVSFHYSILPFWSTDHGKNVASGWFRQWVNKIFVRKSSSWGPCTRTGVSCSWARVACSWWIPTCAIFALLYLLAWWLWLKLLLLLRSWVLWVSLTKFTITIIVYWSGRLLLSTWLETGLWSRWFSFCFKVILRLILLLLLLSTWLTVSWPIIWFKTCVTGSVRVEALVAVTESSGSCWWERLLWFTLELNLFLCEARFLLSVWTLLIGL